MPAWGTSQSLLMIEKYIERKLPKCIIWQICENDFDNNIQYGLHTIKEGDLVYNQAIPTKRDKIRYITDLIPFYNFLVENSHLMNLYRKSVILAIGGQLSKQIQADPSNSKMLIDKKWKLMKKITEKIFKIVSKNNIQILPIFIPSGGKEIQKFGKNVLVDSLFHYFDQNNREYIDFNYLGFNQDMRFSSDGHWKPKAHALAADSIFMFLINDYYLTD